MNVCRVSPYGNPHSADKQCESLKQKHARLSKMQIAPFIQEKSEAQCEIIPFEQIHTLWKHKHGHSEGKKAFRRFKKGQKHYETTSYGFIYGAQGACSDGNVH